MIQKNNSIPMRCPNPDCEFHNDANIVDSRRWFRFHGMYSSKQHGSIPRYRCMGCMRTFTPRTGDMHWYLHDDASDVIDIGLRWLSGQTIASIAEDCGSSIQKVRTRLGRIRSSMLIDSLVRYNPGTCRMAEVKCNDGSD